MIVTAQVLFIVSLGVGVYFALFGAVAAIIGKATGFRSRPAACGMALFGILIFATSLMAMLDTVSA